MAMLFANMILERLVILTRSLIVGPEEAVGSVNLGSFRVSRRSWFAFGLVPRVRRFARVNGTCSISVVVREV